MHDPQLEPDSHFREEHFNLSEAAEIIICSREHAEEFECGMPWACISIAGKDDERPTLSDENRIDLLELTFDDVTTQVPGATLFSDSDAADILDFIETNRRDVRVWMVHCEEGISRSSAVAASIAHYLGLELDELLGGDYDPNQRVLSIMWERIAGIADQE